MGPGLTNESRTTFWLFFHNLLPTQARPHRIIRSADSPACSHCNTGEIDHAWYHSLSSCAHTSHVIGWMIQKINTLPIQPVDINTALWLQFPPPITENDLLCAVWMVGETVTYSWAKRKNREDIIVESLQAILLSKALHLSKTQKYSLAGRQLCDILSA